MCLQDEMADICIRGNAVKCGIENDEREREKNKNRKREKKKG